MPELKIELERAGFYPGQRVAGVVVLNVSRPVSLRGIRVCLTGTEHVMVRYGQQTRWTETPTVDQEVVLVGRERLPDAGAVVVDTWDTFFQRVKHTRLAPGEYIYPFSIPLPSHLPPSYQGKLARVDYCLQVTLDRPLRSSRTVRAPVEVLPPHRDGTAHPLALSISGTEAAPDEHHSRSPRVKLNLELPRQEFAAGGYITGEYRAENPEGEILDGLVLTLRAKEETSAQGGSDAEQIDAARVRITFKDRTAKLQRGEFRLQIPDSAPASMTGRTFSLTYSLDARLAAELSSDLVLSAPVTVTAKTSG